MSLKEKGGFSSPFWEGREVPFMHLLNKLSLRELCYCVLKKRGLLRSKGAEVSAKGFNMMQSL